MRLDMTTWNIVYIRNNPHNNVPMDASTFPWSEQLMAVQQKDQEAMQNDPKLACIAMFSSASTPCIIWDTFMICCIQTFSPLYVHYVCV